MRTIEIKVYPLSELSDDAKEKAIESLYNINGEHNSLNFAYDDNHEFDEYGNLITFKLKT